MAYPLISQLIERVKLQNGEFSLCYGDPEALLVELFAVLDLAEKASSKKSNGHPHFTKVARDEMYEAVKKVCRLAETIPGSYIAKTATALLTMGKTPADVYGFANWWYEHDFRGRKNQAPSMNQVVTLIEQAKAGPWQAEQDSSRFITGIYGSEINH